MTGIAGCCGRAASGHAAERTVLPGGGEVRRGHHALDQAEKAARHRARNGEWHHRRHGYHLRVPYGTLLRVSDKPLHGEIKPTHLALSHSKLPVGGKV